MIKRLPLAGKILYASSSAGWAMIDRIVITWLMFYYVTPETGQPLLKPVTFGLIMFLGRIIDAIADPLVALWSDNFKGRLGRRTPFLLVGGILYVLVFIALFYPPAAASSTLIALYLTVLLGGYFFLFTVYVCPYLALLPELARTSQDRVDLATLRALFTLVGVAIALVGSGILMGILGFTGMVWSLGLLGLIFLYLPALVKERDYAEAKASTLNLSAAISTTFKNKPFLIYLTGNGAFWFGFNIVTLGLPFYVTVLLGLSADDTAFFFAAAFGVAALTFPIINILAKKHHPKVIMVTSMFMFTLVLPCFYFLGNEVFGLSATTFAYILMAVTGIPLASLFVLPDAIVASVTDMEETLSGQRREAMYFGVQGLVLKIIMGFSSLMTGFLLQYFGQTTAEPLGVRLTGPAAAFFIFLGALVFLRYPEKEVLSLERKSTSAEV